MSSIYNVKTLTLNGNQVTRFAEHYNPYNRNKDKTLISQQALEELLKESEVPCDYTFAKQHLLNTTYGNITVKPDDENELYDITYGLHIYKNADSDSFIYSSDNIIEGVNTKTVYIPETAKVFNKDEVLHLNVTEDLYDIVVNEESTVEDILINAPLNICITATSNSKLKNVYYNVNLSNGNAAMEKGDIHTTGTFNMLGIATNDVIIKAQCETLYLSSKFFDNTDLDGEIDIGHFGDWSTENTKITTLVIDGSNLYTSKTGDKLETHLKTILNLKSTIVLVVNE